MAEQAVSALNAVKASQTRKARALLENARLQDRAVVKPSPHEASQANTTTSLHPPAPPPAPEQPAGSGPSGTAADMAGKADADTPQAMASSPADNQPLTGHTTTANDPGPRPQPAPGNMTAALPAGQEAARRPDPAPRFPDNHKITPAPHVTADRTTSGEWRTSRLRPGLMAAVLAVAGVLGYQFLKENKDNGADTALLPEAPMTVQAPFGAPEAPGAGVTTAEAAGAAESGSGGGLTWRPAALPAEPDREAVTEREAALSAGTPLPNTPAVEQRTPDIKGSDGIALETPAAPAVEPAASTTRQTTQRTAPVPPSRGSGYGYYPQQPAWPQSYYRPAYSNYHGR